MVSESKLYTQTHTHAHAYTPMLCYVVGSRRLMPPDALERKAYCRSYLHRQVSPPETLVVKGGTTWARNGPVIWTKSCDFHAYTLGIIYMPQICDMGQTALLPFRRKVC